MYRVEGYSEEEVKGYIENNSNPEKEVIKSLRAFKKAWDRYQDTSSLRSVETMIKHYDIILEVVMDRPGRFIEDLDCYSNWDEFKRYCM